MESNIETGERIRKQRKTVGFSLRERGTLVLSVKSKTIKFLRCSIYPKALSPFSGIDIYTLKRLCVVRCHGVARIANIFNLKCGGGEQIGKNREC